MKIMKYQAETEKEAMLMAKQELGKDALILSIKSVKPKGIFRLFRKAYVEVTAALDEVPSGEEKKTSIQEPAKPKTEAQTHSNDKELEDFKKFLSELSHKQRLMEKEEEQKAEEQKPSIAAEEFQKVSPVAQVIYDQLLENEVDTELVEAYMNEFWSRKEEIGFEEGIDLIYQKIVEELSEVRPVTLSSQKAKPIFFIGSTGVGKTTTIAKLASQFTLEKNYRVALITADTYRIAAVEQLRTYANILNIPIRVIYKEEEIIDCLEEFADMDVILIDTAGRSYQDTKHLTELKDLLDMVEEKQIYLVLSLSTKNSDLLKTVEAYRFADFSFIFTKLDETLAYGNILNLRHKTGKTLSYVTTGQNVPEDIAVLDPHEIASKILGGVST